MKINLNRKKKNKKNPNSPNVQGYVNKDGKSIAVYGYYENREEFRLYESKFDIPEGGYFDFNILLKENDKGGVDKRPDYKGTVNMFDDGFSCAAWVNEENGFRITIKRSKPFKGNGVA